jgi:hypothetical protein
VLRGHGVPRDCSALASECLTAQQREELLLVALTEPGQPPTRIAPIDSR